jgi:peptidoglycan-associated lipoprotein
MTRAAFARGAAIVLMAIVMSACSKTQPNNYGLGGAGGGGEGPITPGSEREFAVKVGDTVHFTVDSAELTPESEQTLNGQSKWLSQYPNYGITIEGHADERGTREYNIALGAQRAATVKQYLATRGINPGRIRTLSYGKERPVAVCADISCWSQNRRAVTVLGRGGGGPVAQY